MVLLDIDEDDGVEDALSLIATTSMIYKRKHAQRLAARELQHPPHGLARNRDRLGSARST